MAANFSFEFFFKSENSNDYDHYYHLLLTALPLFDPCHNTDTSKSTKTTSKWCYSLHSYVKTIFSPNKLPA